MQRTKGPRENLWNCTEGCFSNLKANRHRTRQLSFRKNRMRDERECPRKKKALWNRYALLPSRFTSLDADASGQTESLNGNSLHRSEATIEERSALPAYERFQLQPSCLVLNSVGD